MVIPREVFELAIEDASIATLTVRATETQRWIARVTSGEPPIHVVRGKGVEHHLAQPWAPDEGMTLETLASTEPPVSTEIAKLPDAVEWSFMQWAEGARAESSGGLLASLPAGVYRLVRTKLPSRPRAQMMLGNARVPSPAHALELLDEAPFYAAAIGARADTLPTGATPLVGLAVLDYVGDAVVDGTLFFELIAPTEGRDHDAGTTGQPADADVVVVIPADGALVIDVLEGFSAEQSRVARERWRTVRSAALARRLARG